MKALIDRGAELGVESVVIGMPHRGGWPALLGGSVAGRRLRGVQRAQLLIGSMELGGRWQACHIVAALRSCRSRLP